DPAEHMDPARFAPTPDAFADATRADASAFADGTRVPEDAFADGDSDDGAADAPVPNPLDAPAVPGAGERMALEIVASGVGHVVLPMSVARVFGRKDVVVLPVACELDEVVGLSRADREAAATAAELEVAGGGGVSGVDGNDPDDGAVTGKDAADVVRHPGWDVGLAWLKESDSDLVQAFVGVTRGRRSGSSR
ncbi:MAG: hypothetical protein Q4D18_06495, partial [Micrococcus sp.]|nr:hypothetical protein [Micrococcus sp.]